MIRIKLAPSLIMITIMAAANAQGIHFEQGIPWSQIKEKAKQEHKYIFLDVYATWCGPCKKMDQDIYPRKDMGDLMNDKFISVKVQTDKTDADNADIRKWYLDAQFISEHYQVDILPTFLFLTPDGSLLARGSGFNSSLEFADLVKKALNSNGLQMEAKLKAFRENKLEYAEYMELLNYVRNTLHDRDLAVAIINKYKTGYLDGLSDKELLTPDNIGFFNDYYFQWLTSKDRFVQLLGKQPEVEGLYSKGYTHNVISAIIAREEIMPELWKDDQPVTRTPDWKRIENKVEKKYGKEYSSTVVAGEKLNFYRAIKDWNTWAKLKDVVYKQEKGNYDMNKDAWDVFLYTYDREALTIALDWATRAADAGIAAGGGNNELDTKANLMYKLYKLYNAGTPQDAIKVEQQAIDVVLRRSAQKNLPKERFGYDQFVSAMDKMQKGEPTWEVTAGQHQ